MIYTTLQGKMVARFLFYMKTDWIDPGIIGDYYYGITWRGQVRRYELRDDYKSDNHFPGIRKTCKIIGAKQMVRLLVDNYEPGQSICG